VRKFFKAFARFLWFKVRKCLDGLDQPWPTRGPSTDSEKRYFGAKSTRISEKVQILALRMAIFQKYGPRADLGWPWLV
jgi:hypothetical protein